MNNRSQQPTVPLPALEDQVKAFEAKSHNDFDDNGWEAFSQRVIDYVNDLYVGTRRECVTRVANEPTLKFSGRDVERASMRLDFQRLYGRKQRRYVLQIGALFFSLVTGVVANWAFSNLGKPSPSPGPWITLVVVFGVTIILASISFIKDMEP